MPALHVGFLSGPKLARRAQSCVVDGRIQGIEKEIRKFENEIQKLENRNTGMKITTRELRHTFNSFIEHLEANNQYEFEVRDDYYWDVPEDARYILDSQPTELTVGQLLDDWTWVKGMVQDQTIVTYGLVWFASIIRYVGEQR